MEEEFSGHNLNDFAIDLFRSSGTSTQSLCVSPASVVNALATLIAGSEGKTKAQIQQAVFGSSLQDSQIRPYLKQLISAVKKKDETILLSVANRLYIDSKFPVLGAYSQAVQKDFDASIVSADFSNVSPVVVEINKWVDETTEGKIREIVSAQTFNPDIRLVILNAVYFKARWMKMFAEEETKREKFYSSPTKSSDVEMMSQKAKFLYGENDECQVLALNYIGDSIAMNILLPKEKFGLEMLEKSLTAEKLRQLMMDVGQLDVTVKLPKFKLESDVPLKAALQRMGMTDIFTEDADLSGITGSANLFVSEAKHKTFIEVDEEGTEAAAVTSFEIMPMCLTFQQDELFFTADHPFMFVIQNFRSGVILFVGRYTGS